MNNRNKAVVVGAGPAGLMAAEQLLAGGLDVAIYDAMPSAGRKFLLAGRSGMNLTHAESITPFLLRYSQTSPLLEGALRAFDAQSIRQWAASLGIDTFVGSSGRVFPTDMKAAPLLRAWIQRLRQQGAQFFMRHRWLDWSEGQLRFEYPTSAGSENLLVRADVVVFAMGGASWPRLGSDGKWVLPLARAGLRLQAFEASNCGFNYAWTPYFREKFAGEAFKTITIHIDGESECRRGQFVVADYGIEGSLIYAHSAKIREQIKRQGECRIVLDLLPDWAYEKLQKAVSSPRGSKSWSSHLRSRCGLGALQVAILYELVDKSVWDKPSELAALMKHLPLVLKTARPIDEAISSAGGVSFEELDDRWMLRQRPGHFCAGEMLDWDAPTGGYLLSACFASGFAAGRGACAWLAEQDKG